MKANDTRGLETPDRTDESTRNRTLVADGSPSVDPSDYATIFLTSNSHGKRRVFHIDPECRHLDGSTVYGKDPSQYPNADPCGSCVMDRNPGGASGSTLAGRLADPDVGPSDVGITDGGDLRPDGGIRFRDLSAFQREILVTIASLQERPNGLELCDVLDDRLATEVLHSRLYANLDELANKGLIEKGQVTGRENYYELTSEGYNLLWEESDRLKEVLSEAVVDELQEATEPDEELRDVASATPEGSP